VSQLSTAGWLSPTRAWRLIECPASVRPAAGKGPAGGGDQEVNTGTLAHRVLERWIRAEGYRAADPKEELAEAADACASELRGEAPASWGVSRARLIARSLSLINLIGDRTPDQVLSEVELKDEDLRLRGQLDLLLLSDEIVVIDLKTQTLREDALPEWVTFQLTLYAHLVSKVYGKLPTRSEVFSLNRGRIVVPITDESLRSALELLATARAADSSLALPRREPCFFCDRRLNCEPHWDVATSWLDTDAVQGEIVRLEIAAKGVVAMLLDTSVGPAWATDIPASLVVGIPGQRVRLVRMHGRGATANGAGEWKWRPSSAIAFL
jgi:hypothetical protein